jgi:hypothetical protein
MEDAALYDQLVAGIKEELGVVPDAQAVLELMKRGASGSPRRGADPAAGDHRVRDVSGGDGADSGRSGAGRSGRGGASSLRGGGS